MSLTQDAREEYRQAHHERAMALLDRAYELCPHPIILFNRARVRQDAGDLRGARDDLLRYLDERPDAPDRDEVVRRLQTVERAIADEDALAESARAAAREAARAEADASAARARAEEAESRSQLAPWLLAAGGALIVGVGGGLAIAAAVEAEVPAGADHLSASRAELRAQELSLAGSVLFAIGGAATLAGALWGVTVLATSAPDHGDASVRLGVAPTGAQLRVTF